MLHSSLPICTLLGVCLAASLSSQANVNYDEESIQAYELPSLLTLENGQIVDNVKEWEESRRKEILKAFEEKVYGRIPERRLSPPLVQILEESETALNNSAIRQQIKLTFQAQGKEVSVNILLYLPIDQADPPIFLGYNFYGNQSIIDDKDVILPDSWVRNNSDFGILENRASEASRGKRSHRWPIQKIISEGFGLAAIYYGDIDPDNNDFSDGIHPLFYADGQSKPNENEWGSISAWAWGYSRVLDCLKENELTKESKLILFGHSRLGKTALWAGASDQRFDIVISNNSGCGGAALSRRKIGETIAIINHNFPHWFARKFKDYNDHEELLPVDQHMLIALIAPRPVYIASAAEDKWADPKGEYLSAYHASPIYRIYDGEGLSDVEPPSTMQPIHNTIGYHIREGKHDVTVYDWEQYMKFAKMHLGR